MLGTVIARTRPEGGEEEEEEAEDGKEEEEGAEHMGLKLLCCWTLKRRTEVKQQFCEPVWRGCKALGW